MSDYKIKPRPDVQDLGILEGFMNGGGNFPAVQREAYWKPAPTEPANMTQQPPNSKP